MWEVNAGQGARAKVIRAMGYNERLRLANCIQRRSYRLGDGVYQIRMFAGTIRSRWRRSVAVVVAAADAAVGLPG